MIARSHRPLTLLAVAAVGFHMSGCAAGLEPQPFDAANVPCAFCRMVGSNGRSAGQIVAPREEPRFFDDIGCLRDYLRQPALVPAGAKAFVVDRRTGAWVEAARASYSQIPAVATPMNSHILAYESAVSRAADPEAATGTQLAPADVFPDITIPRGAP